MIEVFIPVIRFVSFTVIFLHAVRTLRNIFAIADRGFLGKVCTYFREQFHDVAIIVFLPAYAYLAFFYSGGYTALFERFVGFPLAFYIGAPLVKEVFFSRAGKVSTKPTTKVNVTKATANLD